MIGHHPNPTNAPPILFETGPVTMQPLRMVLVGVEGWGKTTFGACAPDPVILMAPSDTGYLTLLGAGRVPERPRAVLESWPQLLRALDQLHQTDCRTVVLDTLGAFESLCKEWVIHRQFDGDLKRFNAYGKGYACVENEWAGLLARLGRLHAARKNLLLLCHVEVRAFRDPESDGWDRYTAAMDKRTWALTHRWSDAVLFANYHTTVRKKDGRTQAQGGDQRAVYTTRTPAYDAKNRYGMPKHLTLGAPETLWKTITDSIKNASPLNFGNMETN